MRLEHRAGNFLADALTITLYGRSPFALYSLRRCVALLIVGRFSPTLRLEHRPGKLLADALTITLSGRSPFALHSLTLCSALLNVGIFFHFADTVTRTPACEVAA